MNKLKWINPMILISCFIVGISLFSIDSYTSSGTTADRGPLYQVNQFYGSTGNIVNTERKSELLYGQNSDASLATSRGGKIRYFEEKDEHLIVHKPVSPSSITVNTPKEVSSTIQADTTPVVKATTTNISKPTAQTISKPITPAKAPSNTAAKVKQSTPTEAATNSAGDLDLLARLITAEAQAEPYDAKVAVGAVIMNRVESSDWPNSIKEVIYQNINGYEQFTPVANGWIDKPAEPESIRAAKAALSGVDPTNGAEFYYDDTTTNTWILAKPVSIQIGHMIYTY